MKRYFQYLILGTLRGGSLYYYIESLFLCESFQVYLGGSITLIFIPGTSVSRICPGTPIEVLPTKKEALGRLRNLRACLCVQSA